MFRSLLFLLACCQAVHAAETRPNIIFVFSDDHASHAISAYGSRINKTPSIDRLASEGMLFRNCFCTNSICAPSRAVILTGKHSHLNGILDNSLPFDGKQQHVGKLLRQAGYQTALIGKWHLKSDPTGFDHWAVLSGAGGQGTYYNPEFKTAKGTIQPNGYCTDLTTEMALDWVEKRDPNKPFLLMLQHKAPHRSWEPGPGQLGLYRDKDIPEPETLFDDHAGLASPARKQEMTVARHLSPQDLKLTPPRNLTPEQRKVWDAAYAAENVAFEKNRPTGKDLTRWMYQRYIKDYLRCVAGVDASVGRVLKYLEDRNLAKNTVVIYSSDQGFYLGDRGWYDKRWMYEESLRMPLLVRWPGVVKPGSENRDLVQNLDFAQTFLQIAGASAPADMQGAGLRPLLEGKTPADWRKSIYYHYFEFPGPHSVARHFGVRTDRHKLIHYYQVGEWELFDLEKDPGERKSVYSDPAQTETVATLKAELARLRKLYKVEDFKDPAPPTKKGPAGKKIKPGLALQYTFAREESGKIADRSGNGLVGTLVKGKLVMDDGKPALRLDGDGQVAVGRTGGLDPSGTPLVIGAWVHATAPRGVVAALGGEAHGFSLYLSEGVPTFAVRVDGKLTLAKAESRLAAGRWAHLAGVLDADGKARVWVDGRPSGAAVNAGLLVARPADGFSIGADTGSLVGDYKDSANWTGMLRDVRFYLGKPAEGEVRKWAGLAE